MKNKLLLLLSVLCLSHYGCKKHNDLEEIVPSEYKELIEVITMDPNGVVFKILNDIDSAFYQTEFTSSTNAIRYFLGRDDANGFKIKIDSICLRKYHYYGPDNLKGIGFTWFTKKGQYVCWRDSYTHEDVGYLGYKYLDLGFPNRYKDIFPENYCIWSQNIVTTTGIDTSKVFLRIFPKPLNDTVYTKLSLIRTNKIW